MEPITAKCRFCGKLYQLYGMIVGDQCPECREEAKRNMMDGQKSWIKLTNTKGLPEPKLGRTQEKLKVAAKEAQMAKPKKGTG